MTVSLAQLRQSEGSWTGYKDSIVVGKDILELLGTSMYVDPMTIYREYVQNAADAIDEARRITVLTPQSPGSVEISIDPVARVVRIRDNGVGVPGSDFVKRLTSFGASSKRGFHARGFRGVGRLAGIGYCQELVFRSRGVGEDSVNEMRWDCRKMKADLRASDFRGDLRDLVNKTVETREINGNGLPLHFFEVELRSIVRHRNDCLLSPVAIEGYLSQVAPVPFSPEFRFAAEIASALESHIALGNLDIRIDGFELPIYRPHRNRFEVSKEVFDEFTEFELITIPAHDTGTAALGWVLHHGYKGAIPAAARIKGLRFRSGNMQIGDDRLLDGLFPEQRFNSWSVGEIHVIDERIVSNGRRDQYEQNVHYDNLVNYLTPVARRISARCRTSSLKRNWLREVERRKLITKQAMAILKQGSLPLAERRDVEAKIDDGLHSMDKIARRDALTTESRQKLRPVLSRMQRQFEKLRGRNDQAKPLSKMPQDQSRVYEEVFGLIYKCSPNAGTAKTLIDRILRRLT